MHLSYVVFFQR